MFTARENKTPQPLSNDSIFTTILQQFKASSVNPLQPQVPQPIPVPTEYRYQQPYSLSQYQESWWFIVKSWTRYHYIQTRWDIERTLARLLHRRWGQ